MRDYRKSDYAINKYSPNIVYRFHDEIVEVSLEDYLKENPDKTEQDFAELKALSDEIYYEQDRAESAQTRKDVSIHGLEEMDCCSTRPLEEELEELAAEVQTAAMPGLHWSDCLLRAYLQKSRNGVFDFMCSVVCPPGRSAGWKGQAIRLLPNP